MMRLYLASTSPRRHELLARTGLTFTVLDPAVDESVRENEAAVMYVERMAKAKAEAGYALLSEPTAQDVVLAADTIVVLEDCILGKPSDRDEARQMLQALSGRSHVVMTAIGVKDSEKLRVQRVNTTVFFRSLSAAEIEWYLDTQEPMDKAGAYGIQGQGGIFVSSITGSISSVVGLPYAETLQLLASFGVEHPPFAE
ncbi:septum formation inhibitor Maf [Thiopseudomonas alkaliphila]|uniref:dTTP/UTP pyrophosphatase n=1 Tax=Thiopseudomonas alkaliphila TaxID=1697053 RepID=A0AAW7DP15_9GAMM|nr:Maf family protein [Thiopseudomonas alkaliphila]MDM1695372.1 septum formation inhibitor Maf [Thiopseudomonas alkaliphila]